MKELHCAELGAEGCTFVAKGESNEEIKEAMFRHAAEAHPEKLEGMTDESKAEMNKMMDEKIKDAP